MPWHLWTNSSNGLSVCKVVSNSLKHRNGHNTTESFVTRLSGFMDSQPTQENRSEKDTEESQTKAFVEAKAKIFPQNRERATQLSSQALWTFGFWVGWREISCWRAHLTGVFHAFLEPRWQLGARHINEIQAVMRELSGWDFEYVSLAERSPCHHGSWALVLPLHVHDPFAVICVWRLRYLPSFLALKLRVTANFVFGL